MLAPTTPMFLLIPNPANKRILHPGKVLVSDAKTFEVEFEEPITPAVNADVNAFGEVRGKFFQQGARVTEIRQPGPKPIIFFERVGEPVSAEQRQEYRVSTVMTGVVVRIGREERCPLLDVSTEGFGALTSTRLEMGALVPVLMRFWSEEVTAEMRLQTFHARPDGKFRVGMLVPDKLSAARKALQKMKASVQQAQLARLSGAA